MLCFLFLTKTKNVTFMILKVTFERKKIKYFKRCQNDGCKVLNLYYLVSKAFYGQHIMSRSLSTKTTDSVILVYNSFRWNRPHFWANWHEARSMLKVVGKCKSRLNSNCYVGNVEGKKKITPSLWPPQVASSWSLSCHNYETFQQMEIYGKRKCFRLIICLNLNAMMEAQT